MCYSQFNDIMAAIVAMDADVISIENSRSDERLLSIFRSGGIEYPAGIGPGVYDIHSPRVPDEEEISTRVRKVGFRTLQIAYYYLFYVLFSFMNCYFWEISPKMVASTPPGCRARRRLAPGSARFVCGFCRLPGWFPDPANCLILLVLCSVLLHELLLLGD
jgi:hypothetical protein